ncbi:MAG: hypothetical protein DCF22_00485 [Leptolyngbya sp.]|nr:MAG: hypothetical protein DCF22_00485 [Leptolyngbya sp.]
MKQISGKRAKTDADYQEMARIEWYASLYLDKSRVCVPSLVLESALVAGARKLKLGQQTQAGMFVPSNMLLEFDGSDLTPDQLWERDQNRLTVAVRIQRNRVMRTRFTCEEWAGNFEVEYDDSTINRQQIIDLVDSSGAVVGLCDWRPRFGRFQAEAIA